MKIQILGTGCAKCKKLEEVAGLAANEAGGDYEIEKVSDINKIMSYGVMMTPALALDGVVKIVGRVPSVTEIKNLLKIGGQ